MLRGTGTANWVQGMTVQPIDCDTDIHALDTTEQMNLDLQMTSEMAQLSHDNAMIWAALTGGWTPGRKLREVCPTSCGDCSPDAHGLSLSGLECATNHEGDAEATCSRSTPAVTSTCKPPCSASSGCYLQLAPPLPELLVCRNQPLPQHSPGPRTSW